ncbi:MAG: M14 family metallopeptidase [Anaerolineae bacterium]
MSSQSLQHHAVRRFSQWILLIILSGAAGCQQAEVLSVSVEISPTSTPRPALIIGEPTHTPNPIAVIAPTLEPPPTDAPTLVVLPTVPYTAIPALIPTDPPLPTAAIVPTLSNEAVQIGSSVEGRPLTLRRFGTGERIILLIGAIHGGYEANTAALIDGLAAHFEALPGDILPGITFALIPAANPDGLARGTGLSARFNANGVDLNRNWLCEWSSEAYWRDQLVNPGAAAMSEPETQALSALILDLHPAVVLFYHSAAGAVYAGNCEGSDRSSAMSAVYGTAAGYSYGAAFSAYPVTGTASGWVDALGIPSADVELLSHDDPDMERNLRALMALQTWVIGQSAG